MSVDQKIALTIEETIRPLLQAHQGDLELITVTDDGFVKIRLTGACAACPGAQQTLSEVVEARLKAVCPEIQGVIPVYQVSDDLMNQALKILRRDKTNV